MAHGPVQISPADYPEVATGTIPLSAVNTPGAVGEKSLSYLATQFVKSKLAAGIAIADIPPIRTFEDLKQISSGESVDVSSETTRLSKREALEAIADFENCINVESVAVSSDEKEAATKIRKIDTDQAERHLRLCGIGPRDAVILCAYGETNRYVPERPAGVKNYDWQQVEKEASEGCRRYDRVEAHLKNPDGRTPSFGFISCPGGTRVKCQPGRDDFQEITEGRVVFAEVDKGLTREEQIGAALKAGLPTPTFQFDTGGKSIWSYWTLDRLVPLDELTRLRKAVSAAIEAAHPGVNTDGSLHSLHQPARLAGWFHPKTGKPSKLFNVSEMRYSPEALLAACTSKHEEVAVEEKPDQSVGIWREAELGDDVKEGHYPTPEQLKVPVPLRLAISKRNAQLIDDGQEEGQGTGRPMRAYSLSQALQAAEAQLRELGYDVAGNPEEEFDKFCTNSDFLGKGSLEACRDKHYARENDIGSGDLSKPALLKRITKWAEDNGHWQWEAKGFCKPKSPAGGALTGFPVSINQKKREKIRQSRSVSHRLAVMRRYTFWITRKIRNALRRRVLLRNAVSKLGLKQQLKDAEVETLVMEAQDRGAGNVYKSLNHQERAAMTTPTVEWVIPELLPAKDATMIVGSPKVGKTRLAFEVVRTILQQQECIGFKPCEGKPQVILVSDDQSAGDTAAMLKAAGIYDHPRLHWSQRMRLTEDQLDALLADIRSHQGAIVVIDSLRSITRSAGISENDQAMGNLVYDLKQVTTDVGGTLLLVHHGNKKGGTGQDASSGHSSITGACNGVLSIHYLEDDNGRPKKDSHFRRIVREARSGQGFDQVVRMHTGGCFEHIADYEKFLKQQEQHAKQAKTKQKLLDPPRPVKQLLDVLAQRFDEKQGPVGLIDLLKGSNLCRKQVQAKSEMNKQETNAYQQCLEWAPKLEEMKYLIRHKDTSDTAGSQRRRLWELSQDGRNFCKLLKRDF